MRSALRPPGFYHMFNTSNTADVFCTTSAPASPPHYYESNTFAMERLITCKVTYLLIHSLMQAQNIMMQILLEQKLLSCSVERVLKRGSFLGGRAWHNTSCAAVRTCNQFSASCVHIYYTSQILPFPFFSVSWCCWYCKCLYCRSKLQLMTQSEHRVPLHLQLKNWCF